MNTFKTVADKAEFATKMIKRLRLDDPNNNNNEDAAAAGGVGGEDPIDLTRDPAPSGIQDQSSSPPEVNAAASVDLSEIRAHLSFMGPLLDEATPEELREVYGLLKCPHCPRVLLKRFGAERHIRECPKK